MPAIGESVILIRDSSVISSGWYGGGEMFKTRIIGLFVLIALAYTFVGLWLLSSAQKSAEGLVKRTVSMSHPAVGRAHHFREVDQSLVAEALAESELGVALELLEEFRDDIITLGSKPGVPEGDRKRKHGKKKSKPVEGIRDGAVLADLWVARYVEKLRDRFGTRFFEENPIQEFKKKERRRFFDCAAIDVAQCYWDYTHNTLPGVLYRVSQRKKLPIESRILVTDARGTGLADSQRPKWSAVEGFAQEAGIPWQAIQNGEHVKGLVLLNKRVFFASALAITYAGKTVGSIMVADPIDDQMAREDSDIVGAEVTYAKGLEVIASSLDKNIASELVKNPMESGNRISAYFQAFSYPSNGASDLRVYVSANVEEMVSGFRTSWKWMIMLSILLFVLSIGVLVWLLRTFYTTFETLEQGIHEVINGNLEFQFPFDFKEDISRGLGQSMNLMSLVLQGRPLPEEVEDETSMAWTNELQVLEPGIQADVFPQEEQPAPVAAEGMDPAVLGEESADVYYKRVYQEFVDSRTTLGLSIEGINYPKFMERLVHLEQGLKKKHRCAMVRFVVSTKENEVVLIPVPITR